MTVEIHRTTAIAAPIELVYLLSLSIDIHLESFAPFGEKAVGKLTTGVMDLGDEVTWKARHLGIPFRLTTKITEATAPTWFVDEQVGGPFRHFRHEHRFLETDGKTSMIDHMSFRAPLGPLGTLAEALVLRGYIARLLDARNRHIKEVAERRTRRSP